jgi:hypothetical protein
MHIAEQGGAAPPNEGGRRPDKLVLCIKERSVYCIKIGLRMEFDFAHNCSRLHF